MEKQNQPASSLEEIFGRMDSPQNLANNKVFYEIFGAPPVAPTIYTPPKAERKLPRATEKWDTGTNGNELKLTCESEQWNTGTKGDKTNAKKGESNIGSCIDNPSIFVDKPDTFPLSSSLYYGGQEDMYGLSSSSRTSELDNDYHNGVIGDSRGNWWDGSFHY